MTVLLPNGQDLTKEFSSPRHSRPFDSSNVQWQKDRPFLKTFGFQQDLVKGLFTNVDEFLEHNGYLEEYGDYENYLKKLVEFEKIFGFHPATFEVECSDGASLVL